MKIYEPKYQTTNQAVKTRGRHSHRGNQWNTHRGKFCTIHRGMSHGDSNRDVVCRYCGKSGHIARDCFKKINNDSNNRYKNIMEIMLEKTPMMSMDLKT